MKLNYATVIEHMSDKLGDRPCLYFGDTVTSWSQFEQRSARIAQCLTDSGLQKDSKVGLFLYNCSEYMEAILASYKVRCIPINVNYRYVGDELIYLLTDCEAEALIFHSSLKDRVAEIKDKLPRLKLLICVDQDDREIPDDALCYQQIIKSTEPAPRIERSADDTLMMYTGGTTGMPKGVEYRIGDMLLQMVEAAPVFFGFDQPNTIDELCEQALARIEAGESLVSLPASPLMHTAGIMNSGMFVQLLGGAMVILQSRSFDPRELWQAISSRRVNHIVVVGDTFVKPMLKVLEEDAEKGITYDLSSLKIVVSSGVMFSQESKLKLLELNDMLIMDAAGATEGGMAVQFSNRANPPKSTAEFMAMPTTEIFDEDYQLIPRGAEKPGLIGMGGTLPKGYYKDPEKTARTFRTINGKRWGFTGDMGIIKADGTLQLLGRGSGCINTGGEKVYPEEVEEVVKRHSAVVDCLVIGLPDERFGERVAAVVSLSSTIENIHEAMMEFCSKYLARYKIPRTIKVCDNVQRAPNGKADYKWAKQFLTAEQ